MGKIVIITVILTILVICLLYFLGFFERIYFYTFELGWTRGEKTKEGLVAKYIEGLETKDIKIIERLVPKTYEATEEIQEKIEMFKESDFGKAEISFEQDGHLFMAEIKNIRLKSGEVISDEIFIESDCHQYPGIIKCKKWYLIMGRVKEKHRVPPIIELKKD